MEKIATRQAYGEALAEFGADPNIVVLDADLSESTKTGIFKKKYPDRFFNCGVAECNMMSVAAGIAATGKTVFASSFAMFASGRAFEQIRNSIAYPALNVKIGASHAGITVGEDGASHQCIEDIAIMRAVPNMTIINPADAIEARAAVKAAIEHKGPVYLRLGRLAAPVVNNEANYTFQLGKGIELKSGTDVTIIATGLMIGVAMEAEQLLAKEGINARLINIHTIKPIDVDIIAKAARETGGIVTVEEHNIIGGLGSAVAEVLCENAPTKLIRVGIQDKFGKSGTPDALLQAYGLTAENVATQAKTIIGRG